MNRRQLLAATAAALSPLRAQQARPNILWVTCEDMSPNLGCYGDKYATSPNIDKFAQKALRYLNAWSNFPVCAPARTTIITGMYPPATGSEHMRSFTKVAPNQKLFPCYLRDAGYYCTNNAKEDYNVEHTGKVWDDSSSKAHWRNRASGQPFFSVFNLLITHESQIRTRPHTWVHDPAKAPLPAYHPDTEEVRKDWAQYYDNITTMDGQAAEILAQLRKDGLEEDTIILFYSDHGSGMPRSKRWPYNSGLHVPLLVHIPAKWKHLAPKDYKDGGTTDRLVSFVDLGATVLNLAGIRKPDYHHGRAFLGQYQDAPRDYVYGFRGRMDERYDLVRSVRDKRYIYIRNFMPYRIYGQYIAYMFETPTTAKWHELYEKGQLNEVQKRFWETKPSEELYDLENDHDEVHNLAQSPQHKQVVERMRKAQMDTAIRIRDVGFLPETEFHTRSKGSTPYEMGHDATKYPAERVIRAADMATRTPPVKASELERGLSDSDSGVRYWSVVGLMIQGKTTSLPPLLADTAHCVRIAAAEALAKLGDEEQAKKAMAVLLELADQNRHGFYTALLALNSIDSLGAKAKAYREQVKLLPRENREVNDRFRINAANIIDHILR